MGMTLNGALILSVATRPDRLARTAASPAAAWLSPVDRSIIKVKYEITKNFCGIHLTFIQNYLQTYTVNLEIQTLKVLPIVITSTYIRVSKRGTNICQISPTYLVSSRSCVHSIIQALCNTYNCCE